MPPDKRGQTMHFHRLSIFILLFAATPLLADSPGDAVARYFDALNHQDYERAAATFDRDALAQMRHSLAYLSDLEEPRREAAYTGLFGSDATAESVAQMTDIEFFASLIRLVMTRRDLAGVFDAAKVETVGYVTEGAEVAHVVVRLKTELGDIRVDQVEVFSCRSVAGKWMMMLTSNIKDMTRQFEMAVRAR